MRKCCSFLILFFMFTFIDVLFFYFLYLCVVWTDKQLHCFLFALLCGVVFLFCFVLFCFVLFCFVLFCFVLFCFVLFCFVGQLGDMVTRVICVSEFFRQLFFFTFLIPFLFLVFFFPFFFRLFFFFYFLLFFFFVSLLFSSVLVKVSAWNKPLRTCVWWA